MAYANSVDPDKAAPEQSDQGLHHTVCNSAKYYMSLGKKSIE